MRKCLRCNAEMVEDLTVLTNDAIGVHVAEKGLFGGTMGKVRCAVCPECGYVEIYLPDTSKVKKLDNEQ